LPEGKPWNAGRCRIPGSRGAWLPMQQLENASRVKSPVRVLLLPLDESPCDESPRVRGPAGPRGGIRRDVGSSPSSEKPPNTLRRRRRMCRGLEPHDTTHLRPRRDVRRRLREESRLGRAGVFFVVGSLVRAPKRLLPCVACSSGTERAS
jgi:hypothetical protein